MTVSRRVLLAQAALSTLFALPAFGDTAAYRYDSLGRLTRVIYDGGPTIFYFYDAAGNRTQVTRQATPTFNATINLTSSPANLRALADAAGYQGDQPANLTVLVASNVTVQGAAASFNPGANGIAIDSGVWPTSSYAIVIDLQVSGKVYGGGRWNRHGKSWRVWYNVWRRRGRRGRDRVSRSNNGSWRRRRCSGRCRREWCRG
jgi:YD repeat-containing protein